MGQPKRVWSNKKTVRDGKKSVWEKDGELKTYDGTRESASSDLTVYGSQWEELSEDAELQVYDTNTATNIGTSEDGLTSTYTFKDYDGTVISSGTVDDGETPTAPADPTREATAQYTYTFGGRSPTVGAISKDTTYTATYTSTVNEYTVTIASNDESMGTVDVSSVTADYGTAISAEDNVLTIGETTVTATAETGYVFSSWGTLPETVTEDLTITAEFVADGGTYLEWFTKVDDEHPNECITILGELDGARALLEPEQFNSYTDLINISYAISDTAEGIDENDITVTLGENDDADTMDAYPYTCNVSYSGDLTEFDSEAYVATVTLQDISGGEAVDLGTLTLNKTGA